MFTVEQLETLAAELAPLIRLGYQVEDLAEILSMRVRRDLEEVAPVVYQEYLSTEDAADFLSMPKRTVEQWRFAGTGPHYSTFGRHVRYEVGALRRWAKSTEVDPAERRGAGR